MKRLSDYKGEEAIELWGDLIGPIATIIADKEVLSVAKSGRPKLFLVKEILKNHSKEAVEILERIDGEAPVDGLNVVSRLVSLLVDVGDNADFFEFAGQEMMANESSGSATENTVAEEN